jgi:hypothetical protein
MRLPLIIVLVLSFAAARAQNRLLKTEISISAKNVSVEKVLEQIHTNYNINFSYGKDNLPLHHTTSIDVKKHPLDKVLEQLLDPFDIAFTIIGNQVVLKKKETDTPPPKKNSRQISGIVKDASTKETLPFASITLLGSVDGTISNADGEFVLLSKAGARDTLKVSYLGYVTSKISLANSHDDLTVELKSAATQLASVEIVGRSPESIVLEAIRRIPVNYRTTPYRQTFYLRDRTWADGTPIQATESVYDSYRGDLSQEDYRRQVKLLGARRSRQDKR